MYETSKAALEAAKKRITAIINDQGAPTADVIEAARVLVGIAHAEQASSAPFGLGSSTAATQPKGAHFNVDEWANALLDAAKREIERGGNMNFVRKHLIFIAMRCASGSDIPVRGSLNGEKTKPAVTPGGKHYEVCGATETAYITLGKGDMLKINGIPVWLDHTTTITTHAANAALVLDGHSPEAADASSQSKPVGFSETLKARAERASAREVNEKEPRCAPQQPGEDFEAYVNRLHAWMEKQVGISEHAIAQVSASRAMGERLASGAMASIHLGAGVKTPPDSPETV